MSGRDFAPRRIGELLDDAIALVITNRRTLVPVAAVVVLPVAAAYSVASSFYLRSFIEFMRLSWSMIGSGSAVPPSPDQTMLVTAGLLQGLGLLYTLSASVFNATVYANSSSLLERRDVHLREALVIGFKVFVPLVIVQFIVSTIAGLAGAFSLGIGSLVLFTLWAVAYPVVVLEGGIGNALARSYRLVKGHFWRVLLVTVAIGLLAGQFESALATPTIIRELVSGVTNPAMIGQVGWGWKVFDGVAQGVAIALVLPFSACATLLNYLDLRARDEGMDLIVRARGLLPG